MLIAAAILSMGVPWVEAATWPENAGVRAAGENYMPI